MEKKPRLPSLIWYRISRGFVSAVLAVSFSMASVGAWQSMSSPSQFNPKSLSYHKTTFIDVIVDFILFGWFGFFGFLAFIYLFLFIFSSGFVRKLYLEKYKVDT